MNAFNLNNPALSNFRPSMYDGIFANAQKAFADFKSSGTASSQNLCLAQLEVITALPPEWASSEEQKAVATMIIETHGNYLQFLLDLNTNQISYCNKVGIDLNRIVIETRIAAFLRMQGIDDRNVEINEIVSNQLDNLEFPS